MTPPPTRFTRVASSRMIQPHTAYLHPALGLLLNLLDLLAARAHHQLHLVGGDLQGGTQSVAAGVERQQALKPGAGKTRSRQQLLDDREGLSLLCSARAATRVEQAANTESAQHELSDAMPRVIIGDVHDLHLHRLGSCPPPHLYAKGVPFLSAAWYVVAPRPRLTPTHPSRNTPTQLRTRP